MRTRPISHLTFHIGQIKNVFSCNLRPSIMAASTKNEALTSSGHMATFGHSYLFATSTIYLMKRCRSCRRVALMLSSKPIRIFHRTLPVEWKIALFFCTLSYFTFSLLRRAPFFSAGPSICHQHFPFFPSPRILCFFFCNFGNLLNDT